MTNPNTRSEAISILKKYDIDHYFTSEYAEFFYGNNNKKYVLQFGDLLELHLYLQKYVEKNKKNDKKNDILNRNISKINELVEYCDFALAKIENRK